MDTIEQKIRSGIEEKFEKHGWTTMAVMPGESGSLPFAYSIGFEKTFKMPEVIFVGFDHKLSQSLIASIASSLKSKDLQIPTKEGRMTEVIQKFDVLAKPVPDDITRRTAFWAIRFNEPNPVRLTQIILPDPKGKFPGEAECDPNYAVMQDIESAAVGD